MKSELCLRLVSAYRRDVKLGELELYAIRDGVSVVGLLLVVSTSSAAWQSNPQRLGDWREIIIVRQYLQWYHIFNASQSPVRPHPLICEERSNLDNNEVLNRNNRQLAIMQSVSPNGSPKPKRRRTPPSSGAATEAHLSADKTRQVLSALNAAPGEPRQLALTVHQQPSATGND